MCAGKRTVRGLAERGERWKKGAGVAAGDASRWRYQGTDVNGGEVCLSYVSVLCVGEFAFDEKIEFEKGPRERARARA